MACRFCALYNFDMCIDDSTLSQLWSSCHIEICQLSMIILLTFHSSLGNSRLWALVWGWGHVSRPGRVWGGPCSLVPWAAGGCQVITGEEGMSNSHRKSPTRGSCHYVSWLISYNDCFISTCMPIDVLELICCTIICSFCRHLRHKNLVQLVGLVFVGPTVHSIVMELMGKVQSLLVLTFSFPCNWILAFTMSPNYRVHCKSISSREDVQLYRRQNCSILRGISKCFVSTYDFCCRWLIFFQYHLFFFFCSCWLSIGMYVRVWCISVPRDSYTGMQLVDSLILGKGCQLYMLLPYHTHTHLKGTLLRETFCWIAMGKQRSPTLVWPGELRSTYHMREGNSLSSGQHLRH